MKRTILFALTLILVVMCVPAFNASAATYTPGQIIYQENFDNYSGNPATQFSFVQRDDAVDANTLISVKDGKLVLDSKTATKDTFVKFPSSVPMTSAIGAYTMVADMTITYASAETNYCSVLWMFQDANNFQSILCRTNGEYQLTSAIWQDNKLTYMSFTDENGKGATVKQDVHGQPGGLNATYKFKVEVTTDNGAFGYLNGTLMNHRPADKMALTDGYFGLRCNKGTTVSFDNIMIYAGTGVQPNTGVTTTASGTTAAGTTKATTTSAKTFDNTIMIAVTLAAATVAFVGISKRRAKAK